MLEVMHELMSKIISLRMLCAVNFCEEVHGFRRQRGACTVIGETKLGTQMATCEHETLHQVFSGLRKSYDSIDRERALDSLRRYGMGPRLCPYIETAWENLVFVLR